MNLEEHPCDSVYIPSLVSTSAREGMRKDVLGGVVKAGLTFVENSANQSPWNALGPALAAWLNLLTHNSLSQ